MKQKQQNLLKIFLILLIGSTAVFGMHSYGQTGKQESAKSWEEWYESIIGYIDETTEIIDKASRPVGDYLVKPGEMAGWQIPSETAEKRNALKVDANNALSQLRTRLVALKPPADFKNYHKKAISIIDSHINFINDENFGEIASSYAIQFQYKLSELVKEIEAAFIEHGAPQNYIDAQRELAEDLSDASEFQVKLARINRIQSIMADVQEPDFIKFEEQEGLIDEYPLSQYKTLPTFDAIEASNQKGYRVAWTIQNDELFLTRFFAVKDGKYVNISDVFPFTNEPPIKAEWYTGKITIHIDGDEAYLYENRVVTPDIIILEIEKGKVVSKEERKITIPDSAINLSELMEGVD